MKHIVIVGGGFAGLWGAMAAVRQLDDAGRAADVKLSLVARSEPDHPAAAPRGPSRRADAGAARARPRAHRGGARARHGHGHRSRPAPRPAWRAPAAAGPCPMIGSCSRRAASSIAPTCPASASMGGARTPSTTPWPSRPIFASLALLRRAGAAHRGRGGGGFTGIEVAAEMVARLRELAGDGAGAVPVRVVLVEQADVVGPDLGDKPRPGIEEAWLRSASRCGSGPPCSRSIAAAGGSAAESEWGRAPWSGPPASAPAPSPRSPPCWWTRWAGSPWTPGFPRRARRQLRRGDVARAMADPPPPTLMSASAR